MENKIKREAHRFLQLQFKKYDPEMTGAIKKKDMSDIIRLLLKEEPTIFSENLLWEQINKKSKDSTFMTLSSSSKEFELSHEEERLDWTSVMDIVVYFLKKVEKKNNDGFVCKHLIKLTDFPAP